MNININQSSLIRDQCTWTVCYIISLLLLGMRCYLWRCPGSFPAQHSFPLIPFSILFLALEITLPHTIPSSRTVIHNGRWGQFIRVWKTQGWQLRADSTQHSPKWSRLLGSPTEETIPWDPRGRSLKHGNTPNSRGVSKTQTVLVQCRNNYLGNTGCLILLRCKS